MAEQNPGPIERIVLGPRDNGRNYGLLACSEHLRLTKISRYYFERYNHYCVSRMRAGECFHELIYLDTETPPVWVLLTNLAHKDKINGNLVVTTWGQFLTQEHMHALRGRAHLLIEHFDEDPPLPRGTVPEFAFDLNRAKQRYETFINKPNELLPDMSVFTPHIGPLLADAKSEDRSLFIATDTDAPHHELIARIMETLPECERRNTTWRTDPVSIDRSDIVCFGVPKYKPQDHALHISRRGIKASQPTETGVAWDALLRALEKIGPEERKTARWLQRYVGIVDSDSFPIHTIAQRIQAMQTRLLETSGDEAARSTQRQLYRAVAGISSESIRDILGFALSVALEEQVKHAKNSDPWLRDAAQSSESGFTFSAPLFLPRLMRDTNSFLRLGHLLPEQTLRAAVTDRTSDRLIAALKDPLPESRSDYDASLCAIWSAAVSTLPEERCVSRPLLAALNRQVVEHFGDEKQPLSEDTGERLRQTIFTLVKKSLSMKKPTLLEPLFAPENREAITHILGEKAMAAILKPTATGIHEGR